MSGGWAGAMAEIDFARFGDAFEHRLEQLGYSYTDAERKWPSTDRAMLSRACAGKTLSAGNYLLLCQMAGLDPYRFMQPMKRPRFTRKAILEQAVTRGVARETGGPS